MRIDFFSYRPKMIRCHTPCGKARFTIQGLSVRNAVTRLGGADVVDDVYPIERYSSKLFRQNERPRWLVRAFGGVRVWHYASF
jgi:hypothetical protein